MRRDDSQQNTTCTPETKTHTQEDTVVVCSGYFQALFELNMRYEEPKGAGLTHKPSDSSDPYTDSELKTPVKH